MIDHENRTPRYVYQKTLSLYCGAGYPFAKSFLIPVAIVRESMSKYLKKCASVLLAAITLFSFSLLSACGSLSGDKLDSGVRGSWGAGD
jgi:hypothetical protein